MDITTQKFQTDSNMQFLSIEELEMIEGGVSFGDVMKTLWTGGTGAVGALGGAAAGGAVTGGNPVGAVVGGVAGAAAGSIVGEKIWDAVFK